MCTNINTNQNGQSFACGQCNSCLNVRKSEWIARACAHRTTVKWAGVLNLSYQNEGRALDGSKQFRYRDVSQMFKRLRERISRRRKFEAKQRGQDIWERPKIDYLVCGERGSDTGRVHWHIVLFADEDLFQTGSWADFKEQWNGGFLPSDGPQDDFLIEPSPDRQHQKVWDLWPYGHVTIDHADSAGISYALKYILKDQFSAMRSKGTNRFTKAENAASSYFVKTPNIGLGFVYAKLDEWRSEGRVPVTLNLTVPGLTGYWWPRKHFRETLLNGIRSINSEIRAETGKDAPQWQVLLASLTSEALNQYRETLLEKEMTEHEQKEQRTIEAQEEADAIKLRLRAKRLENEQREVRRRCGGYKVCDGCHAAFLPDTQRFYEAWVEHIQRRYLQEAGSKRPVERRGCDLWFRQQGTGNPFCSRADKPQNRFIYGSTFPEKRRVAKLRQEFREGRFQLGQARSD